jgi:hypothetical protein
MTIHYIIQCTAEKSLPPGDGLSWDNTTSSVDWKKNWEVSEPRKLVSELYTGRTFRRSKEAISVTEDPWVIWVASAGGGLLRGPSSTREREDTVPGYEAYCFPSSPMGSIKMRELWEGIGDESYTLSGENSWSRLDSEEGDCLAISLSKSYQAAILPSIDEYFSSDTEIVGMGSCLPHLGRIRSVGRHPRIREVLGCGFSMMRTVLLEKWIAGGDEELERLSSLASKLDPPPLRGKISDTDLRKLISEADPKITDSITRTIRWVRNDCRISASEERIKLALR